MPKKNEVEKEVLVEEILTTETEAPAKEGVCTIEVTNLKKRCINIPCLGKYGIIDAEQKVTVPHSEETISLLNHYADIKFISFKIIK